MNPEPVDADAGAGRGPALWSIACNEWFKAQRCKEGYYLYAVVHAAASPRLYLVRNPAEELEPEERVEVGD